MVFHYEPPNDFELEELDELQMAHTLENDIMPMINVDGPLPDHLIIGLSQSAHAFINGFGFKKTVGKIEMGSSTWEIKASEDEQIWIINMNSILEPNQLAAAIIQKIPARITSIIDMVLDDQIYAERLDESFPVMTLESRAVKEKSSLRKLPIPGYITGFSAAFLSMANNRGKECRVFLVVSDYQSLLGTNPEIVNSLIKCIPDLFSKSDSENILSKVKDNLAALKPMKRSSMFV